MEAEDSWHFGGYATRGSGVWVHLVKSVHTLDTLFQSFRKHVYKVRAGDKAQLVEPWPSMHRALSSARVLCTSGAVEHAYNLST